MVEDVESIWGGETEAVEERKRQREREGEEERKLYKEKE